MSGYQEKYSYKLLQPGGSWKVFSRLAENLFSLKMLDVSINNIEQNLFGLFIHFFNVANAVSCFLLGGGVFFFSNQEIHLLSGLAGAAIAEGGYLTFGGGLAATSATANCSAGVAGTFANTVSGGVAGGAGSLTAGSSFSLNYGVSSAFSVFNNFKQLSNSSSWRTFGLIAGYSLVNSVSIGLGSKYSIGKLDKYLKVPAYDETGRKFFSSVKGAAGKGWAGFTKSVGNSFLNRYDPVSNRWNASKLSIGGVFTKGLLQGYFGAAIGQSFESTMYGDYFGGTYTTIQMEELQRGWKLPMYINNAIDAGWSNLWDLLYDK